MSTKAGKTAFPGATRVTEVFAMDPDDLELVEDKDHQLYDERVKWPVSERLVLSIMARGVRVPVKVIKDGEDVLVVDGRQRVKAAREANKRLKAKGDEPVLVRIVRGDKGESMEDAALDVLELNEIRQASTLVIKMRHAKRLMAKGHSEEAVARACGITTQTLDGWMKLLAASKEVIEAVEMERVPLTTALKDIVPLARDKQAAAVEKAAARKVDPGKRKNGEQKAPTATARSRALALLKAVAPTAPEMTMEPKEGDDAPAEEADVDHDYRGINPEREQVLVRYLIGEASTGDLVGAYPKLAGLLGD